MRWRLLLIVSLAANFLLAGSWYWSLRKEALRHSRAELGAEAPLVQVKTNVVIRRQFFTWQQVESDDYRQYIANLRDIGCPEQTIRDIIIADVNALYARKRANEILSPEQQWWRSVPDADVERAARARISELEAERRSLLTGLLGLGWESGDLASIPRPTRAGIALDGPVLGALPEDVKKTVQQIVAAFQDQADDWLAAQEGRPTRDIAALSQLNRQLRKDLAQVLSPSQLEEFLLRYSTTASALRTELGRLDHFNVTPDEFRALFRANDAINMQLQSLAGATDAASQRQRAALEQQRDQAIRNALSPERYAQYRLLEEEAYRAAVAMAAQSDAAHSTPALYEINRATAEEMERVRANTNLTDSQRALELKRIELEQLKAVNQALGEELPPESPTEVSTQKPPPGTAHTIRSGETLATVARLYSISIAELREANPHLSDRLRVGDSVTIPFKMPPAYVVPQQ
ncbi:MAG TPA: LysM domain-containing protein [Verrucomicrobiota bacterium]|nr:LysM domain-containing protein [Verrucomicrobiota bacterium]